MMLFIMFGTNIKSNSKNLYKMKMQYYFYRLPSYKKSKSYKSPIVFQKSHRPAGDTVPIMFDIYIYRSAMFRSGGSIDLLFNSQF